ncbi:hypothetical protein [Emticicia sp. 17c]|uniref:hypothetical protein n=1 Tax=Emticicia sp. 17c TaxID=3127704 RepID=UPI00301CD80F
MINNPRSNSVLLNDDEIDWLWKRMLLKFQKNEKRDLSTQKISSALEFWQNRNLKSRFMINFGRDTDYKQCRIPIDADLEKGKKAITDTYLRNHLIVRHEKSFQYGYLNRMVFYITQDTQQADWSDYFRKNGFPIYLDGEVPADVSDKLTPGIKYLKGTWLSFNRNLEQNKYARCLYRFSILGSQMLVDREGYNAEISYHGKVTVQDDSSYMFDLTGKKKQKRKFVIADTKEISPNMLACISSAFSIDGNKPVLVKEMLIKLPDNQQPELTGGIVFDAKELGAKVKEFFDEPEASVVLEEIEAFLGADEVPYFSLDDLVNIKKQHLSAIEKEKLSEPKVYRKQSVYVHFNRLGKKPVSYEREIVKYYRDHKYTEMQNVRQRIVVEDEYMLMKICQYTKHEVQKHKVSFEAEDETGIVDVQALFPIANNDLDNDFRKPHPKYSNLVVDEKDDTFVSKATFINDFINTKRIAISFEEITQVSEIVIDFGSIEDFEAMKINISQITYCFNVPDRNSMKMITLPTATLPYKNFVINKIDRNKLQMDFDHSLDIDPANPKIFTIKVNCELFKDDYLYIYFNLEI